MTVTSWFDVLCMRCVRWLSGRVSALHSGFTDSISSGGRSRYTLLMRSSKVETAVFPYVMRKCLSYFLVVVIQLTKENKKRNFLYLNCPQIIGSSNSSVKTQLFIFLFRFLLFFFFCLVCRATICLLYPLWRGKPRQKRGVRGTTVNCV